MEKKAFLQTVLTKKRFSFNSLLDVSPEEETLEVVIPGIESVRIRPGKNIWQRFAEFLPFSETSMCEADSLGEGNTPLLNASENLKTHMGLSNLLLKNETVNPTWSFKDRGSLTTIFMAREMRESKTATISTGNMGNSMAAYSARAGLKSIVFIPHFAPVEKVSAMAIHGATIVRIESPDYSATKAAVLSLGMEMNLRIVSGNGPIRTEGYKLTSFEMYEQLNGIVPDYIAVPTSACGHIRGLFKGYTELFAAGLINRLPKMIIVQAEVNSPIVSAYNKGMDRIIPFSNFSTIAEAITSGNPPGGKDLLFTARENGWLASSASEEEIIQSREILAAAGFFTEPSTAVSVAAVRKLVKSKSIDKNAMVVMMLTGSGLKDMESAKPRSNMIYDTTLSGMGSTLKKLL